MAFSLFVKNKTESFIIDNQGMAFQSATHEQVNQMLAPSIFSLQESSRGFELTMEQGTALLEGHLISEGTKVHLPSGREFIINQLNFVASIKSERVDIAKKEDIKSWTARGLIASIILCELLFITVFPSQLNGESNFKREYLLEEISEDLDILRKEVQENLRTKSKNNSVKSGILQDIKDSLDELANDIRLKPKAFNLAELEDVTDTLSQCEKLIQRLKISPFINDENLSLDKQALLDQVFTE
ncbi:hypothetical protein PQO03_15495 [Lentisphaera profundi]|uniref:Uncharacterized protein n=1 Tax=Lentisphaera profundi TaxID=1658616 RepID=A0ABY7W104_9BACT|nr:hypothetical protein [Lentisphaera profundi]WDE99239.1 hypothetical protein PQO03_15495 [Lentisphaera profundi]